MQSNDRKNYKKYLFASRDTSRILKYRKSFRGNLFHTLSSGQTGMLESDAREKPELFNDYFVSVVTNLNYKLFEPIANQLNGQTKLDISNEKLEQVLTLINAVKI